MEVPVERKGNGYNQHLFHSHLMKNLAWTLSSLGQLAITLEASSPKPGNVNRLRRFSDTGYRHFLASAALVSRGYYSAASRGIALADASVEPEEVRLGQLILDCVSDVFSGINKSNAIFGSILLHVPLITATAACIKTDSKFSSKCVERFLKQSIEASTVEDTINLYKAFLLARPRGDMQNRSDAWESTHDRLDISNPHVFANIRQDNINLLDLFKIAEDVDAISREWVSNFRTTLQETYPYLDRSSKGLEDLEEAVVKTFVWRLSIEPDGLIVKKAGSETAERVRAIAADILEQDGKKALVLIENLEKELTRDGNLLNPGTTADLISAAIFCKLVNESMKIT
ncbi:MAG: triphosphoribosyl-dephospho-CoA synthase [Candidatus Thorarchaeota archaeon]